MHHAILRKVSTGVWRTPGLRGRSGGVGGLEEVLRGALAVVDMLLLHTQAGPTLVSHLICANN